MAEVTGCYDVFPRKQMQYVIREAALASHSSRQLMYAGNFFKKMKHGVKKATGFATKVAAPVINTFVPPEY